MVDNVTTRVLRDKFGNPNGAGVKVRNDEWSYGGEARTNQGSVFVQGNYGSSNIKTQIDYAPDSLSGTLTSTSTRGKLSFVADIGSNGLLTGLGSAKIGNSSTVSFSTQAGFGFSYNFGNNWGSFEATLNPKGNAFNVDWKDSGGGNWGFLFSTGYSSASGWSFNTSIFSSIFN